MHDGPHKSAHQLLPNQNRQGQTYPIKCHCFMVKIISCGEYFGYLHQTYTDMFNIIPTIKQMKFHLCSRIIGRIGPWSHDNNSCTG